MSVTQNIFIGAAWAGSTAYGSAGLRATNGSNLYEIVTPGTSASSGGPTGTGSSISDGTCVWKFVSAIDYTSLSSWTGGLPGTPTQDYIANFWKPNNTGGANDGKISISAGFQAGAPIYITMLTTSHSLTIQPATGESMFDAANPLWPDASKGVMFYCSTSPGNNYSYLVYIDAGSGSSTPPNGVKFSRMQFDAAGYCAHITNTDNGATATIYTDRCILRAAANAPIINAGGNGAQLFATNTTIIDLQASGGSSSAVYIQSATSSLINCTIYAPNSPASGQAVHLQYGYSSVTVENCILIGHGTPLAVRGGGSSNYTSSHNLTDQASLGSRVTDTGSLLSKTAANQFVSPTSDLHLKSGADAINAGIDTHTSYPNTAVDSYNLSRPQGTAYCIGAVEYVSSSGISLTPGAGALSIASSAPSIVQNTPLSPGVKALTLTGQTPTKVQNTPLVPGVKALTFTKYAPTVGRNMTPGVKAVVLSGQTPAIVQNTPLTTGAGSASFASAAPSLTTGTILTPGAGSVALAGQAASLDTGINPLAGAANLSGQAPVASQNTTLTPSAGALALAGQTPSALASISLSPGPASLSLSGQTPLVSANANLSPGAGALSIADYAPTTITVLSPGPGAITISSQPPVDGVSIPVGSGALTISTFAPATVSNFVPGPAALTLTPSSASLGTGITVGAGALSLAGYAPVLTQSFSLSPGPAALSLTGQTPTLPGQLVPATASIATTGYSPKTDTGDNPGAGAIVTGKYGPVLSTGVVPGKGSLSAQGYAPTLLSSLTISVPTDAVLLGTYAPSMTSNLAVSPGTKALTLIGNVPKLDDGVPVGAGALSLASYAPALGIGVSPPTRALGLSDYAPPLDAAFKITSGSAQIAGQTILVPRYPATTPLSLSTYFPSIDVSRNPGVALMAISGAAPSLAFGGVFSIVDAPAMQAAFGEQNLKAQFGTPSLRGNPN